MQQIANNTTLPKLNEMKNSAFYVKKNFLFAKLDACVVRALPPIFPRFWQYPTMLILHSVFTIIASLIIVAVKIFRFYDSALCMVLSVASNSAVHKCDFRICHVTHFQY